VVGFESIIHHDRRKIMSREFDIVDGEYYFHGTSKVFEGKLQEGDIVNYYNEMPFDKDGYHCAGHGVMTSVQGRLVDVPVYEDD
jgi:hypothetical protein